jgi:P27 family predicted phage terminase small subunit
MSADRQVSVPSHLSVEAKGHWARLHAGWQLDDAGDLILLVALEAFDRMRGAQKAVKREGITLKGRAHPATTIERDARLAMLRALRQLGLDLEPVRDRAGRPGGR